MTAVTGHFIGLYGCRSDRTDRLDRRHRPHWRHRLLRSALALSLLALLIADLSLVIMMYAGLIVSYTHVTGLPSHHISVLSLGSGLTGETGITGATGLTGLYPPSRLFQCLTWDFVIHFELTLDPQISCM